MLVFNNDGESLLKNVLSIIGTPNQTIGTPNQTIFFTYCSIYDKIKLK